MASSLDNGGWQKEECSVAFFEICAADETKAVCNTCGEKISRGGKNFTTSNLKKHLKLRHTAEFTKMEKKEKQREADARIQQEQA